jgi:hypothetical protein
VAIVVINRSRVPDELLEPLLQHAAEATEVSEKSIYVRVGQGRRASAFTSSRSVGGHELRRHELLRQCEARFSSKGKRRRVDVRIVVPSVPVRGLAGDAELLREVGRWIWNTAAHEFWHAREFLLYSRQVPWAWERAVAAGHSRRGPWRERPEEKRAMEAVDALIDKGMRPEPLCEAVSAWYRAARAREVRRDNIQKH